MSLSVAPETGRERGRRQNLIRDERKPRREAMRMKERAAVANLMSFSILVGKVFSTLLAFRR